MRYLLFVFFLVLSISGISQVYNPIPQYVFRNKLGVGRSTPVDSAAYMNIGPNGGANAGVVLPRVADTASILGTKRNGLLIFSLQLNKFAWWDSTAARWTEVGSGSGSSGGEVMLMNGSSTVGDSLLFSSVSGDTAYFRNLLFEGGNEVTNQGDTVLRVFGKNIANSNLVITDVERYLGIGPDSAFYISSNDFGTIYFAVSDFSATNTFQIENLSPELNNASFAVQYERMDSTANIRLTSVNSKIYPFTGDTYGNRQIQLDTTGVRINGTVYGDVTRYANTSNHNINLGISTHILNDLTGAASRTIALHPKPSGALIKILNQSSDGTNKWSFAGATVYDKDGTTVTTLDDLTCYELMYLESGNSNFGAGWHIIKKY